MDDQEDSTTLGAHAYAKAGPAPDPQPSVQGAASALADEFDPARLRLNQDFFSSLGVEKLVTQIPVRKPDRHWWIRVHPALDMRVETAVLELKEERETYLVDPKVLPELPGDFVAKIILTAINRQGLVFLWPIKLPDFRGRLDEWNHAALAAAKMAESSWIRLSANMAVGSYDLFKATGFTDLPSWPSLSFRELLRLGFKDRVIRTADDPVVQKLKGRI